VDFVSALFDCLWNKTAEIINEKRANNKWKSLFLPERQLLASAADSVIY
jgi:hypothetical protein